MSQLARDPDKLEPISMAKEIQRQESDPEVAPRLASSRQPSPAGGYLAKWQEIIWREWRNCEDEEYAEHLFNLVSQTSLGGGSILILTLSGTLYGLLAGYLLGVIALNFNTFPAGEWLLSGTLPTGLAWLGGAIGGGIGVALSQRFSWRVWLGLLTPSVFANKLGGLGHSSLGLFIGFVAGLFALNPFIISALIGALVGLVSGSRSIAVMNMLASLVGTLIGSLIGYSLWLGLGLSLVVGIWLGITWGSAPLGLLISWLGLLLGLAIFGLNGWVVSWLGLTAGFGLGIIPNMLGRGLDAANAYRSRSWYFWWQGQPPATVVEKSLRLAAAARPEFKTVWADPLHHLEQHRQQFNQPTLFLQALQSPDWIDRFAARHALVALGGEAVKALHQIAADSANPLQQTALLLLAQIEQETTNRLAWRKTNLLCPHCLTRFDTRVVNLPWSVSFTYYGCRLCGQSREFVEWLTVVAILDTSWTELYARQDSQLRLNWLQRRKLFDFDRVEIIQAGDEEVERFAVQVGNDTDPFRKLRYPQMSCAIGPNCHLSENTLRILRRTFGEVITHAPHL
jgi:hypothetical protein